MKTKNIFQSVNFNASAKSVYDALMNSKPHSKFTGDKAVISKKVGGSFKIYGDYITGINLSLHPNKLIIQAWRSSDWPQDHYSIVTYKITEAGKNKTKLEFSQIGVPADDTKEKAQGWKDYYWGPMKELFEAAQ